MKGMIWKASGIAYLLFVMIIPWLPGINTEIFGISLRMHSAGNLTAGLLWIFLLLFLCIPSVRTFALNTFGLLDNLNDKYIKKMIWISGVLFFVISASYKLKAHFSFQTHTCDLGLFSTICWNTLKGRIMWSSLLESNYFGVHWNPILILIAPFFALWENAGVLLVIQSAVIALTIPAVYEIARFLKIPISRDLQFPIGLRLALLIYPMKLMLHPT